jgi:lysyl-tRNA synthetase class 1
VSNDDGTGDGGDHRAFWADAVADEILDRDPADPIVVKGAVSPSGIPHVGHFNEILRGYYVAAVLRERGREVRQVFVSDDRDPLRKLPRRLADADWNLVELGDVDAGALGRNLGVPYSDIPDPFGDCHESYGAHFTDLLRESAEMVGVPLDIISVTERYEAGAFDDAVREVLANADRAREVLGRHQAGVDESYVPFRPNCASCGKQPTTEVTAVDLDRGRVAYECVGGEAGDRELEGCGHEGEATFREGKLPWRFEWPAGWQVFGVDFEPFGKDHAEGSWPSGQEIAREVYGFEPPVGMTYEWFTLAGEALSSSSGNVVTVPEILDIVEPEVLRYFFARSPRKQRDLDLERADRLVGAFDRFESTFYAETEDADTPVDAAFADRAYPLVVGAAAVDDIGSGREYDTRLDASAGVAGTLETGLSMRAGDRLRVETSGDRPFADRWLREGEAVADHLDDEAALRAHLQSTAFEIRDAAIDAFGDRVRLPYTFAAVLGMTDDRALRLRMARREGHLDDEAPDWAVEAALKRVERARRWAEREDNEYNYRLAEDRPDVSLDAATAEALDELAAFVAEGHDGDAIQGEIYETAKRHDIDMGEFFGAGYRLFLDEESGPQLGPFLAALDREFVVERLRRAE